MICHRCVAQSICQYVNSAIDVLCNHLALSLVHEWRLAVQTLSLIQMRTRSAVSLDDMAALEVTHIFGATEMQVHLVQ